MDFSDSFDVRTFDPMSATDQDLIDTVTAWVSRVLRANRNPDTHGVVFRGNKEPAASLALGLYTIRHGPQKALVVLHTVYLTACATHGVRPNEALVEKYNAAHGDAS